MAKSVQNRRVEVGVRELKSKLSHYIDLVQHGSEVIVTEHGKPVATLVAIDDLSVYGERINLIFKVSQVHH